MLVIFHVLVSHLYILFGEVTIQIFCPFFNWVACFILLTCKNSCIFSQSLACLFHSLNSDFVEQKFLMKSNLSIFFFMGCAFYVVSKYSLLNPRSPRFSPMLSSRSFTDLCFTVSSMIHFELIFVNGVKSVF